MLSHSKIEQARIIGQIQGCYSNASTLLKPTVNQIDFEKAVKEDKTPFFFEDVIKGYASKALTEIQEEKDEVKKAEILSEAKKQLAPLSKVVVVFDNMSKSLFIEAIDVETNTYKDISINRLLDRVGQVVK